MNNERSKHPRSGWLELDGQVCVITGAAGGIGEAIAQTLAAAGARLALLDRDLDKAQTLATQLQNQAEKQAQNAIIAIGCDIGDEASVAEAAARVASEFGTADVLVNNAGLLRPGGIESLSLDDWNAMLRVNLTGYMLCSQAFGKPMLGRARACRVDRGALSADA
jgi:NAD(P)-dependent dehydrogenase (short-subunit alcohol dehydrogenase family)